MTAGVFSFILFSLFIIWSDFVLGGWLGALWTHEPFWQRKLCALCASNMESFVFGTGCLHILKKLAGWLAWRYFPECNEIEYNFLQIFLGFFFFFFLRWRKIRKELQSVFFILPFEVLCACFFFLKEFEDWRRWWWSFPCCCSAHCSRSFAFLWIFEKKKL